MNNKFAILLYLLLSVNSITKANSIEQKKMVSKSLTSDFNDSSKKLDEVNIVLLKSLFKKVNFLDCNESIIISTISKFKMLSNFSDLNEFEQRKIVAMARKNLDDNQKKVKLNQTFYFISNRLFDSYDFEKQQYSFIAWESTNPKIKIIYETAQRFSRNKYLNEQKFEHFSPVKLINAKKFPLELKLSEEEASNTMTQKKLTRENYLRSLDRVNLLLESRKEKKYYDDFHNYSEDENRILHLKYYINFNFDTVSDSSLEIIKSFEDLDNIKLEANIIRIEVFIDLQKGVLNGKVGNINEIK